MKASADRLILTCEHGGNTVPRKLRARFAGARAALDSHRGWDPGALALARHLHRELGAPLFAATTSRLVVDLNRSPHHPHLFSAFTRPLDAATREYILARHYRPHRRAVEAAVQRRAARMGGVLHVAVHSFTPVLDGVRRNADIGLLYDPSRRTEAAFVRRLRAALWQRLPGLRVRCNYPYRGSADGLTTHLRRLHADGAYAGIELELNQALVTGPAARWRPLRRDISAALRSALP